jgi:exopolysaccharide biosynthesis protein
MNRKTIFIALIVAAIAAVASADWTNVGPGVDFQEFAEPGIDVYVTRIDLTNDQIQVIGTRESERGLKVSDYAKREKAIAAVNGDYFDDHFVPIGLTIGPCGQWAGTKDTGREGVIAIGQGRAWIQKQADVYDPPEDWVETAISGWPMIVKACEPLSDKELPGSDVFTRSPQPRTAVGISRDRHTLFFVVADGRRTGVPGMTLGTLASFMSDRLGVCAAMNVDGGGSAAMWVTDKIVNRPSDGVERKVGDHLAVVLRSDFVSCDPSQNPMTSSGATKDNSTKPSAPPVTSTQPR